MEGGGGGLETLMWFLRCGCKNVGEAERERGEIITDGVKAEGEKQEAGKMKQTEKIFSGHESNFEF